MKAFVFLFVSAVKTDPEVDDAQLRAVNRSATGGA